MGPRELLLRLGSAALLGSLIGLERQRLDKAAGLRTHMLVSVGSALVMIVSAYGFDEVLNPGRVALDPSRVAAQVVSGIGFLGAGAILRRNQSVHGLTTAASIWTVAGVGLAAGAGLHLAAATATGLMLVILAVIKPLEDRLLGQDRRRTLRLMATDRVAMADLEARARGIGVELLGIRLRRIKKPGIRQIELTLRHAQAADIARLVDAVKEVDGVRQVQLGGK
jgi:putative Mg2+ transporter-C (MgtC) family protein